MKIMSLLKGHKGMDVDSRAEKEELESEGGFGREGRSKAKEGEW